MGQVVSPNFTCTGMQYPLCTVQATPNCTSTSTLEKKTNENGQIENVNSHSISFVTIDQLFILN